MINKISHLKHGLVLFFAFLILILYNQNVLSQNKIEIKNDTTLATDTTLNKKEIVKSPKEIFENCALCHTIGKEKLVGPDLMDVITRHDSAWFVKFINSSDSMIKSGDSSANKLYLEYNKLPMPNYNFKPDEIKSLLDFIEFESKKLKANPNFLNNNFNYVPQPNKWIFIICVLFVLLSIVDLLFIKFIKYKVINLIILLSGVVICGKVVYEESKNLGRSIGYEPDQPIKFSHRVHAGENKINCIYCHSEVNSSRYANIPPVSLCLNCHNVIRFGTNTGEEEINKIHLAVDEGRPINWVKVYNLPDHVFFSHAQHVKVGKIDCDKCHGDVKNMGRIQQVVDLSMGWCINCHRQTEVQFSNKYYTLYKQQDDLKSGKIKKVTVEDIGGNNCQKCHY